MVPIRRLNAVGVRSGDGGERNAVACVNILAALDGHLDSVTIPSLRCSLEPPPHLH